MKDFDKAWLLVYALVISILVVWVRINIIYFRPVLEDSTLFFQLVMGVTVVAVLRNLVGVKTYGVFGPTIIVFGLLSAGLIWGLALFIDVFVISILTAFALYPLALTSSHRVAIVIITTVMLITVMELVGEVFHMNILQSSIFFPVLITSWLADRFVGQVKEMDWTEPSKKFAGTFVVIIIAYFVMVTDPVINFIAVNPETWAVIITIHLLLAIKINFRLSEYIRFKPVIMNTKGGSKDALGLNQRNRDYVARYNPRDLFPNVSKDKMKQALHWLNVPTPATFAIVNERKDISPMWKSLEDKSGFVIKPSNGLGGEGILVVRKGENNSSMFRVGDRTYTRKDLENHLLEILDGRFSSGWDDTAIIEEIVDTNEFFSRFSYKGLPDIRVIVFLGYPIMAMTRLPTKESGGKANLHKGAIGMGLSISTGKGRSPYWRGHGGKITYHPDTRAHLEDLHVPDWKNVLEIACMGQGASKLGYVGIDIVFDRTGPMILEVNKRPGLDIQIANLSGLLKRLKFVEDKLNSSSHLRYIPVDERCELARKWDREGWR